MRTKLFLFTVFIAAVSLLSTTYAEGSSLYSSTTMILKFKVNSPLLESARSLVPENYHDKLEATDEALNKTAALKNFLTANYITSIKAVKPDASLNQLPGGIERIFIIEISEEVTAEYVHSLVSINKEVEYIEYDYYGKAGGSPADLFSLSSVIPNDGSFSSQWGLRNTGQNVNGINGIPGGDINAVNAWDITTGAPSVIISILDTGIPLTHLEFAGRLLQGYDFVNNDNSPTDDHGHGTNVASIAAAKGNNGSLVAGVNWNCKIIPVKVLDATGFGAYAWWISGITYSVDNGAKVINMSVGGTSFSQALSDAVTYAVNNGRIVVACMMNDSYITTYYPAGYDNVISVGAVNNKMWRAAPFCWGGGSNYGPHIDFMAPGEMILGLDHNNPNSTVYWCGTSAAAPMVSGLVSLLFSVNNKLTYTEVYNALKNSARDQVGTTGEDIQGFDLYYGWGLIDSRGALNQIIGITPISTTIPQNFRLEQSYPNPFNPAAKIRFDISKAGFSKLYVYDAIGREISMLVNEDLNAGTYEVEWNASNFTSGTYFYRLVSGNFSETKKMILVK